LQYQGQNYLVPIDADINEPTEISVESLDLGFIENKFTQINSKANIFILDSCRDNPFETQIKEYSKSRNISSKIDRGLANTQIKLNESLIAFATSPNEVALDNPDGKNGIFTKSLLNHITKENLTIQEVLELTGKDIVEETNNKQRPWIHNSIFKTKPILNYNENSLAKGDNKEHLEEIERLKNQLNTQTQKESELKNLESKINQTLNSMQSTKNIEDLENAKKELENLNSKMQSVKIEKTNAITITKDILVYSGKNIDKSVNIKRSFKDALENYSKFYIDKEISKIEPFKIILSPQSEFETDIEYKIRKIEFEQEKIKYQNEKDKKIDKIKSYIYSKEQKNKILDTCLGVQKISMEYNANTQTFNVKLNSWKFDIKIPRDIAKEFKQDIKSFDIYIDFKNYKIVEISVEYKNNKFIANDLPKIEENSKEFEELFIEKFIELEKQKQDRLAKQKKEKQNKLEKEIKLKKDELVELDIKLNSKKGIFSSFFNSEEIKELELKINNLKKEIAILSPFLWKDSDTNLIWQTDISKKEYNYKEALNYAKELNKQNYEGFNDWRVPTIDELKTLLTKEPYKNSKSISGETYIKKPLLNSMDMEYQLFWSSSKYNSSRGWIIHFNYGNDYYNDLSYKYYVRCVRGEK